MAFSYTRTVAIAEQQHAVTFFATRDVTRVVVLWVYGVAFWHHTAAARSAT